MSNAFVTTALPALAPNQRDVTAMSRGISRNMALDGALLDKINAFEGPSGRYWVDPASFQAIPRASGGGDLNGSANTANLLGHAGTGLDRLSVPRQNIKAGGGNYCGVV